MIRHRAFVHTVWLLVACAGLGLAGALHAQPYKIVGPDGRITYTDRPDVAASANQVAPMRLPGAAAPATEPLPFALREPAARFPVVLFTIPACAPCDNGRNYLRRRGIPFTEKTITTPSDQRAFEKLNLGNELPVLRVGQQVLRNYSEATWAHDLDLAGYPAQAALPNSYHGWEPTPLAGSSAAAPASAPPPRPQDAPLPLPSTAPPASGSIRF